MPLKNWKEVFENVWINKRNKAIVSIEDDETIYGYYLLTTPKGYHTGSLEYLKKLASKYLAEN